MVQECARQVLAAEDEGWGRQWNGYVKSDIDLLKGDPAVMIQGNITSVSCYKYLSITNRGQPESVFLFCVNDQQRAAF